ASDDIIEKGLSADSFVNRFKNTLGLRGGGKKTLVQGVIADYSDNFLGRVEACVGQAMKS
ncbi:MAG: hypothetical protein KKF80_06555, partial [Candidatus Omnitrophica bacterium]|nr:hypothetical protein [Candidatus Omnitrophota bacterium]